MLNRKPIFDEVRRLIGRGFSGAEVRRLDSAISRALGDPQIDAASPPVPGPAPHRELGQAGRALIHKWEGCARRRADGLFDAYPDPGSRDGHPWTIGWGSTGAGIGPGTVWTQAQCDARFDADIARYAREVADALGGAPTTPGQFDALVSFHYNTGAIRKATLTRLHCAGRHEDAAAQFGKWVMNDGKPLEGLRKRRQDEAALYRGS